MPLSVGLITSRHYLSEHGIKMEVTDLTRKQPATLSKYAGLGAAMTAELMIGFWFSVGVMLAVKMVNGLDYCIEEIISQK